MRFFLISLVVSGCVRTTIPPTTAPLQYNCGDVAFTRDGDTLMAGSAEWQVAAHDTDGTHFRVPQGDQVLELTVPVDARGDAVERVFLPAANNQVVRRQVCRVRGGYTDLAARYVAGESLDDLAKGATNGDREAAYMLVRDGMANAQRKLRRDR